MQKHVVSISGGKDSTAMYLMAMERLQGDFIPVFADTGNEHDITYNYVSRLAERTGGPAIQWVKADFRQRLQNRKKNIQKKNEQEKAAESLLALGAIEDSPPYLAMCVLKGMFPSRNMRFCTEELKILPIKRTIYVPLLDAGHTILSWQGIRADESAARSKMPEIVAIGEGITAFRPLLGWTVEDVFAMHRRHGLAPNPLYKMGMTRVGCMPCFMARKSEISHIARRFPEHIEKIRSWENHVQAASRTGRTTFFTGSKVPGTDDIRVSVDKVIAWAQGKTPGQAELYEDVILPGCKSEYGLCE